MERMIRITRGRTRDGKFNPYKIFIDDVYRGKIGEHETKGFEVETGSHIIYAKILWLRSKKLPVEVNDSVIELEVGNALDELNPWLTTAGYTLLHTIVFWNEALFLREKKTIDEPQAEDVE